jgi:hypothetical protein
MPPTDDLDLRPRDEPFPPGSGAAIVEVLDGKVWTVRPVTVVRDTPAEIALWLAPGTVHKYPTGQQHGTHTIQHWLTKDWELIDKTWLPPGKLRITRPGDPFDVWTSPASSDRPPGPWYVNLQEPLRRVQAGFVTMDHVLDLVVAPDLRSWTWKDEEELAYAQHTGFFTAERTAQIRSVGEAVIAQLEAGTPPWDPDWSAWSPGA